MAKKKETVKVKFTRGYSGPEGIYITGDTDVFDKEVADALIAQKCAKVYIAPPVAPAPENDAAVAKAAAKTATDAANKAEAAATKAAEAVGG